jgi:hypothetical protein
MPSDASPPSSRTVPFCLSMLSYNTALVPPLAYEGGDRAAVLRSLCDEIRALSPDVACLCELFDGDERASLRRQLGDAYPFHAEGPNKVNGLPTGGLLALCKHPCSSSGHVYRRGAGTDWWADKGVLHLAIRPPGPPCDLFFSHTQSLYGDDEPGDDSAHARALRAQLRDLGVFVAAMRDPSRPAFLVGDLNVAAEGAGYRSALLEPLGEPIDLWPALHPDESGHTFGVGPSFFDDPADVPAEGERLDYQLMWPGTRLRPVPKTIEIVAWQSAGHEISDHRGLCARFDQASELEAVPDGPLRRLSATIRSDHCLCTTAGPGADEPYFELWLEPASGHGSPRTRTPVLASIGSAELGPVPAHTPAVLATDPGEYVDLCVHGWEHDPVVADDDLGMARRRIARAELCAQRSQRQGHTLPPLTGDGGSHVVVVELEVE